MVIVTNYEISKLFKKNTGVCKRSNKNLLSTACGLEIIFIIQLSISFF